MTHPYGSVNFYIHEVLAVSRRVGTCVSWTLEKLGAVFLGIFVGDAKHLRVHMLCLWPASDDVKFI